MSIIRPGDRGLLLRAIVAGLIAFGVGALAPGSSWAQPVAAENALHTVAVPKPWPMHHLVAPGTLTVGITAKSPPKSFTNPAGEFDGSRVALFKKMAEDLGLKLDMVRLDWPGILPGLAANRFDLACESAAWNNDRLSSNDFLLTRPVAVTGTTAVVRADSGIHSWADLAGKTLGGVRGELETANATAAGKPATVLPLPGHPEGIQTVLNKQVDAFATDLLNAHDLVEHSPRKAELVILQPTIALTPSSLCVNVREPDLLVAVDVLLTNYRVDGTLAALDRQYVGNDNAITALSTIGY